MRLQYNLQVKGAIEATDGKRVSLAEAKYYVAEAKLLLSRRTRRR